MIQINKNIEKIKTSATLTINEVVNDLRFQNIDVVHFGFGKSPFPIHNSIVSALQNNAANNDYLSTLGLKALRIQISEFLLTHQNIDRDWSNIFIGPGSKELLYQTILMLDGVFLIPKGSWVSYLPQVELKGGKFHILETSFDQNFKLTADTLERFCFEHSEDGNILILNSPNNPTGAIYSDKELNELADVCKTYKIIVLSDEIYSQINFNSDYSPSISLHYPEGSIVFGGMSKVFSAGGYRLGFIALPKQMKALNKTYRALFSETFSAVASPIQFAAIEAYKMNVTLIDYINKCTLILKEIGQFIYNALQELNIQCTVPQGAFYMIIGFSNYKDQINSLGITTSEELALHLLNKYKVALLPGSDFYIDQDDLFLRLAFVDFDGENAIKKMEINTTMSEDFIISNCPKIIQGLTHIKAFVNEI